MKTGSAVSAIATPSATRTTPTSTPCRGPTSTSSSFAPSRRRITCSNSSAVAFPVRCSLIPSLPPNGRTASTRASVARTGSGAAPTADTTQIPAAPASSTSAAFPAWMPPIPTTGSAVSRAIVRRPSRPRGSASGLVGVAQTVTPR